MGDTRAAPPTIQRRDESRVFLPRLDAHIARLHVRVTGPRRPTNRRGGG